MKATSKIKISTATGANLKESFTILYYKSTVLILDVKLNDAFCVFECDVKYIEF